LILPPHATVSDLQAAAGDLASQQLDPRRPMWDMHVVEKYLRGSAIIARFHHCYADGVAMLRVLLSLADSHASDDSTHRLPLVSEHVSTDDSPRLSMPLDRLIPVIDQAVGIAKHIVGGVSGLASSSLQALGHPLDTVQRATAAGLELAKLATLSDDHPTLLKKQLSARKVVSWGVPLQFAEVRTMAHANDCTINDVLLSTVAGALGAWLRDSGERTDGVVVRALVPVNLRPPDDPVQLGNRFGLVFANLYVGIRDPMERLRATHDAMLKLKTSAEPLVSYALLATMGSVIPILEEEAIDLFTRKASLVVSNVPGPREPLRLCGARIDEIYFWVPQAGSIGLGLSLLTYGTQVQFGVMSDHELIAAPQRITELFVEEFEKLILSTLLACKV
jgi:WS/DGAT/MGAT family acyltransferase